MADRNKPKTRDQPAEAVTSTAIQPLVIVITRM